MNYKLKHDNNIFSISSESSDNGIVVQSGEDHFELTAQSVDKSVFILQIDGRQVKAYGVRDGDRIFLNIFGRHFIIDDVSRDDDKDFSKDQGDSADSAIAPMPGSVLKVLVNEGDTVKFDQALVIIEAMKMENEVRAPRDAIVKKIVVDEGMQVGSGDNLILFESS